MSRFYVTTPIYYVNAEPHLGHAYTTIVGDALTRWHRLLGKDVTYLTGTDEYGLKIQRAAEEAGLEPQAFADSIAPKFAEAWKHLEIANDDFIRTTEPGTAPASSSCSSGATTPATSSSTSTAASTACAASCTTPMTSCCPATCARSTSWRSRSSRRRTTSSACPASRTACAPGTTPTRAPSSPEFRGNEALGLIRSGLRDFSVSRTSLTWGVPLPWDPAHVTYVWFDALTNYLSAIGFGSDAERFEQWWPVDYHLIGKDIIRQHCVYWPAMLLSAGLEPPRGWAVGGWLLVGGEKMSKTTGNVVKPLDLVDTVGVDGFRYYILADTTYGQDGDFTYEGLVGRYNSDLANNLGNLTARVATVVASKCGGPGRPRRGQPARRRRRPRRGRRRGGLGRRRAEPRARRHVAADPGHQRPPRGKRAWKLDPGPRVDAVLGDALEALRIVAVLASPAVPAPRRRSGAPRAAGRGRSTARASRRRVGRLPGGLTVTQGSVAVPADPPD